METNHDQTLPPVSALEDHLGFWLRYVSNHVSERFAALLAQRDISVSEWVTLRTLYRADGCSHAALLDVLGMSKGAASKILSRLEQKGLAQRSLMPGRAREQRLQLTPAGLALLPQLAALADQNDAHYFGHLDAQQKKLLLETLQDMVRRHQLPLLPRS